MPLAHGTGIVGIEQSPPDEPAQHTLADAGSDRNDIGLAERGQLADAQLSVFEVEHGIDDTAMEMDVLVERITEAMDETDGAETGVLGCIRATFDQRLLNHPQQEMQNRTHRRQNKGRNRLFAILRPTVLQK